MNDSNQRSIYNFICRNSHSLIIIILRQLQMFKPSLKRSSLNRQEELNTSQVNNKQPSQIKSQDQRVKIIPEYFFQSSKQSFLNINSQPSKYAGLLNSVEFHYPKDVQEKIHENDDAGSILLAQQIFCYFKGQSVYFWYYSEDDLFAPKKHLNHTFEEPITSIAIAKLNDTIQFETKQITLVAVSFGYRIKLFSLNNFSLEKLYSLPQLEDLYIIIKGMDLITKLEIITQPHEQFGKSNFFIVFGDISGNISFFDLKNKRKLINDSMKKYFQRVIPLFTESQTYYKQILYHKRFVYCFCHKSYKMDSVYKKIQRLLRRPCGLIQSQQFIQIYQVNYNYNHEDELQLTNCLLHEQITSLNLFNKIKSSFGNYFKQGSLNDINNTTIQSISCENDNITVLFKSGLSIQIDEHLSFVGRPIYSSSFPKQLSLFQKLDEGSDRTKEFMKKGYGNKIQLYQQYMIADNNEDVCYFTPFINIFQFPFEVSFWDYKQQKESEIKSKNSQYILFTKESIYLIEKISKPLVLMMYSLLYKNFSYGQNEETPQEIYFKNKINNLRLYWGEVGLVYEALQTAAFIHKNERASIFMRKDIVQIIKLQLSQNEKTTQIVAKQRFNKQAVDRFKRQMFILKAENQEILWNIIMESSGRKIETQRLFGSQVQTIQTVCAAFHIKINSILKKISKWNSKNFVFQRKKVYETIFTAEILILLLQKFQEFDRMHFSMSQQMIKSFQKESDKFKIKQNNSSLIVKSSQSRFCQLSSKILEKIIILLKLYDYIGETGIKQSSLIPISVILRGIDEDAKIKFSSLILNKLDINNDILLDLLAQKVPELNIQKMRRYETWKKIYYDSSQKQNPPLNLQINQTLDEINSEEAMGLQNILIPQFYDSVFIDHFIRKNPIQKPLSNSIMKNKIQHLRNEGVIKVISILLATFRRIHDLKRKQINLKNLLYSHTTNSNDLFNILEIPSLHYEHNRAVKEREFFIQKCKQILDQILAWYRAHKMDKKDIYRIIQITKNELPIQLRLKWSEQLKNSNIEELSTMISERKIFTNSQLSSPQARNIIHSRNQLYQSSLMKQ